MRNKSWPPKIWYQIRNEKCFERFNQKSARMWTPLSNFHIDTSTTLIPYLNWKETSRSELFFGRGHPTLVDVSQKFWPLVDVFLTQKRVFLFSSRIYRHHPKNHFLLHFYLKISQKFRKKFSKFFKFRKKCSKIFRCASAAKPPFLQSPSFGRWDSPGGLTPLKTK